MMAGGKGMAIAAASGAGLNINYTNCTFSGGASQESGARGACARGP
jgi:hypothetical protein